MDDILSVDKLKSTNLLEDYSELDLLSNHPIKDEYIYNALVLQTLNLSPLCWRDIKQGSDKTLPYPIARNFKYIAGMGNGEKGVEKYIKEMTEKGYKVTINEYGFITIRIDPIIFYEWYKINPVYIQFDYLHYAKYKVMDLEKEIKEIKEKI